MATYVIGDIHGEYDKLRELLEKMKFSDDDYLYVLGDVIDRGPHPIKVLSLLMTLPNCTCIAGNHERMALPNFKLFMEEVTEEFLFRLDHSDMSRLTEWQLNGAESTIDEFSRLSYEEREGIIDFIGDFEAYSQIEVNNKKYLLVHAGLLNFYSQKRMEFYDIDELVWVEPDYSQQYFKDTVLVTGHTSTQLIEENPNPGYIYRANNHIAMDCGACFEGGRLAGICLETGEEFYAE